MKPRMLVAAIAMFVASLAAPAEAGQTHVAVAANFTEPAKEIAALFKQKTGHEAVLIFGASGAFFTQITHGAPFEVFLSADEERPKAAVEQGFAVAGQPVHLCDRQACSVEQGRRRDEGRRGAEGWRLRQAGDRQSRLPRLTEPPAIETMKALGVYDALQAKIVQGNSIAQAFQFVDTRNAEVRFRRAIAAVQRHCRIALAGSAKPLFADPAGRRAARRGAPRTRRRSLSSSSSRVRKRAPSSRNSATRLE